MVCLQGWWLRWSPKSRIFCQFLLLVLCKPCPFSSLSRADKLSLQIALGYIFISLLVSLLTPGRSPRPRVDGQALAVCAIAFVLSFFTGSMAITHFRLILLNQSTIESMAIADMKRSEQSRLGSYYGKTEFGKKRRAVKEFDQEWGTLNKEANLWWLGKNRKNWTAVMGTKALAWMRPYTNILH